MTHQSISGALIGMTSAIYCRDGDNNGVDGCGDGDGIGDGDGDWGGDFLKPVVMTIVILRQRLIDVISAAVTDNND